MIDLLMLKCASPALTLSLDQHALLISRQSKIFNKLLSGILRQWFCKEASGIVSRRKYIRK